MFNAFSIVTFEVLFLLLNVMLLNACFERALHCELHCVLCWRNIDWSKCMLAMMMMIIIIMMAMIVFDNQYFCKQPCSYSCKRC